MVSDVKRSPGAKGWSGGVRGVRSSEGLRWFVISGSDKTGVYDLPRGSDERLRRCGRR